MKTRQTELSISLYSNFIRKEFMEAALKAYSLEYKDYDNFVKNHGVPFSENPAHTTFHMTAMHFQAIGVLLKKKLVDIEFVADLPPAQMPWEKMKPIAEGMRKQFKDPRHYKWFEYLYNEVQKRR